MIGHSHTGIDGHGNPTQCEAQHAFGQSLQGIYVRLADRRPFDLVALDYRVRNDPDPMHTSDLPGLDPMLVKIWIGEVLDLESPAGETFSSFIVGDSGQEMRVWDTLEVGVTDVTGIFITSTGNVSFDNLVLQPR